MMHKIPNQPLPELGLYQYDIQNRYISIYKNISRYISLNLSELQKWIIRAGTNDINIYKGEHLIGTTKVGQIPA